ncbi:fam-m protein [Plasmodium brasilianum]|uniref:fam-m protein n=1 Tax=Plasmodium brasilianum TaxID=5824 RepID=UPI00350E392E|nr:fam-m protein [Plasmodium brasilianum]
MEKNIILILIIKFYAFILLRCLFHLENDSTYRTSINNNYKLGKIIVIRNYRLLAKYKQDVYSSNSVLRRDMSNKLKYEKKDIHNKEKAIKEKNSKYNRSLLNQAQYYTEFNDYNNGMFDGKHFHFEKKWIKKKKYDDFFEKNKRIGNIALNNIKFRSYSFGVAIIFLIVLLVIGYPILHRYGLLKKAGDQILNFLKLNEKLGGVEPYICVILYGILIVLLSLILIIVFPKILINNEKYNKYKLMTE